MPVVPQFGYRYRKIRRDYKKHEQYVHFLQCCGAGAGGAEIIWGPGAAQPEPKINIFCSQFGGC